jgi:integrase
LRAYLRLGVKDLDLEQGEILVHQGKGNKDRHTMLPEAVKAAVFVDPRLGSGDGVAPQPPSVGRPPRACVVPALPNAPPAIPFATCARRIRSRPAMMSGAFRSCWGGRMGPRRWCTHTCGTKVAKR